MTKVDEAWKLFNALSYNFVYWPSTFSACQNCGDKDSYARGAGKCANCCEKELVEFLGGDFEAIELAAKARAALEASTKSWLAIADHIRKK